MRLEQLTVGHLRAAVRVYLEVAWAGAAAPAPPELPGADGDPVGTALGALVDESVRSGELVTRRHALRLGQPAYPFMKLMLEEHLVVGEFFFGVDCHDGMFEGMEGDEALQMMALRRANLAVKDAVEEAWFQAGLPTARGLRGLVEIWPVAPAPRNGRRILLVDNDHEIAAALSLLLAARGYEVTVLGDGRQAVEQADPARHDLVLMDNEMPYLNGFEACRVLKSRPATARLPVLIATAGALTLQQLDAADGFLVKPFRLDMLEAMLEQMLGRSERN